LVTKKQIDDFYILNIDMLEKIAAGISYKNNKGINPSAAISESFIYVMNIKNKIKPTDLQKVVINYIKQEVGAWSNSQLNLKEGKKRLDTYYVPDKADDTYESIDDKIKLEIWYSDRKSILFMYRKQETNKIKQIIFDCYFNKGLTKGLDMAKHLKINKDYASKYIRELKMDVKNFYEQNK